MTSFVVSRPHWLTNRLMVWLGSTVLFASIAVASYQFVVPFLLKIPADFSYNADVTSLDNFYDVEKGVYGGEQISSTIFGYSSSQVNSALEIDAYFRVSTVQGEPIFAVSRLYGIDPWSGRHISGAGDRDRDGYLFAPRMKGPAAQVADKSTFTYWHVNYNTPALLQFQEEETLYGLEVYRYEANYFADQTQELTGTLPGVGSESGISLDIKLQVWVEPYTGRMVQYKDATEAYYYDLTTKQRLHPWNNFSNRFSARSLAEQVTSAALLKQKILLVGVFFPVVFGFLAALSLVMVLLQISVVRKVFERVPLSFRALFLPVALGLVTLMATFTFAYMLNQVLVQQTRSELSEEIAATNDLIVSRLDTYAGLLKGGAGFLYANPDVSRQEWKKYVETLDLHQQFPGVQGVGLSLLIKPEDLGAFEKQVQDEGFPDFRITPGGERQLYSSIVFIEPFDERNQRAFGYDMLSESVRRAAMNYARDSGQPAISGKVRLKQENDVDVQPGFLLYEPLYTVGTPSATVQERRQALYGYVYSPFRAKEFMRRVLLNSPTQLYLSLYDSTNSDTLSKSTLLFTNKLLDQRVVENVSTQLSFGGKTWTVVYHVPPGYGQRQIEITMLRMLVLFGIAVSILLASSLYILHMRRVVAVRYAHEVTKDLHKAKEKAEILRVAAEEKYAEADRFNKLMVDRELRMVELKEQIKQLQKDTHDTTRQ